jgi:hypothetical protein
MSTVEKLSETLTTRLSQEAKLKLAQKAMDKGVTIGTYCGDILMKIAEMADDETIFNQKENQISKVYLMLDKALERNFELQEQLKKLIEQQHLTETNLTKIVTDNEVKPIAEKTTENGVFDIEDNQKLAKMIIDIAPEKKRAKFEKQFNKMVEYRLKSGSSKSTKDVIYQCVEYSMNRALFFDDGN